MRLTNLVTTDAVADVLPRQDNSIPVADAKLKNGDRFVSSAMEGEAQPQAAKATKTAEVVVPIAGTSAPPPVQPAQ